MVIQYVYYCIIMSCNCVNVEGEARKVNYDYICAVCKEHIYAILAAMSSNGASGHATV